MTHTVKSKAPVKVAAALHTWPRVNGFYAISFKNRPPRNRHELYKILLHNGEVSLPEAKPKG